MQATSNTIPAKTSILLPDELIFYILHFLDPYEVIRLRLVSKQFRDVTRDTRLWRALYIYARLPRPPGPFSWQSTQFLERTLSRSARISQTWTSQPIRVVSRVQGPRIASKASPISISSDFLFGRLFIWCEGEQLLAQDVETGVGRLLYESTEPISSLSACSLTCPDSERVFVALRHIDTPIYERTPIKLLEFQLEDDVRLKLGPVASEMDLPACANFPLSANAHLLYFDGGRDRVFGPHEPIVIDTRTRATYKFPSFSSTLDVVVLRDPHPWKPGFTLLSGGYIVVFRPWCNWCPPMTLIQAFVAPESLLDLGNTNTSQLRLTHEAIVEHAYIPTHPLRNATLDLETGEASVRFFGSASVQHGRTHYFCIDVTIPRPSSYSKVLPLFINTQEVFVLPGSVQAVFLDASSDGHGRGIVTLLADPPDPFEPKETPVHLYKFSVDASGKHCTAMVSKPTELNQHDVFPYKDRCVFDGVRGRFCHDPSRDARTKFYDLVAVSLN